MSDVLKNEIIARAALVYGTGFAQMIHSVLLTYRRRPGFGGLVRVYECSVGGSACLMLTQALDASSVEKFYPSPGCLQIREQLLLHILRRLQKALILEGQASGAMRDLSFGGDLGL